MSDMNIQETARMLFESGQGVWPFVLVRSLSTKGPTLPLELFLRLANFILENRSEEVNREMSEIFERDTTPQRLLALDEVDLQDLSQRAWRRGSGAKLFHERRALSRLYGSVIHYKNTEIRDYLSEAARGILLLGYDDERGRPDDLFEAAIRNYEELMS